MTILAELARLYDRLQAEGEAPPPGFSRERIGFELIFASDGRPVALEPLGDDDPDRPGRRMYVPMPPGSRRGTKIVSGTFWDPAPYVLGIAQSKETGDFRPEFERAATKHDEFVRHHHRLIVDHPDPGLRAFLAFLDRWTPDEFSKRGWDAAALTANIVFRWEADPEAPRFLHDREAATALLPNPPSLAPRHCLVTGNVEPTARLHPAIKGVDGGQSSGAAMVSFNDEAYTSFGAHQGANAPVGSRTAFAYATALNTLLDRSAARQRRLKIANSTVVFWADGDRDSANDIESLFADSFDPPTSGDTEAELRTALTDLADGRAATDKYDPETRVFVLGLAPNVARLSVRFWQVEGLDTLARNILRFWEALRIEPMPWKGPPAAWSLLHETAIRGKDEKTQRKKTKPEDTIAPRLAGELMRAVLGGQPLPRSLMNAVILRIRADGRVNGRRVAICKAVVNGNREQEIIPVALNPTTRTRPTGWGACSPCWNRRSAAPSGATSAQPSRTSTSPPHPPRQPACSPCCFATPRITCPECANPEAVAGRPPSKRPSKRSTPDSGRNCREASTSTPKAYSWPATTTSLNTVNPSARTTLQEKRHERTRQPLRIRAVFRCCKREPERRSGRREPAQD